MATPYDNKRQHTRPAFSPFDPSTHTIALQLVDVDYLLEASPPRPLTPSLDGASLQQQPQHQQPRPVLRLFGVNDAGNSVVINVHNFNPYLYVSLPLGGHEHVAMAHALHASLETALREHPGVKSEAPLRQHVLHVEAVHGYESLVGARLPCAIAASETRSGNTSHTTTTTTTTTFLKITLAVPQAVPRARRLLQRGLQLELAPSHTVGGSSEPTPFHVFEGNLEYILQFMVDRSVAGGGWVEVPADTYTARPPSPSDALNQTYCQLELDVNDPATIIGHTAQGAWARVAPMRILSVDVECHGRKGFFPRPESDPIIQIACILSLHTAPNAPIQRRIYTLGTCNPIENVVISCFDSEKEMLTAWSRDFVVEDDPDIVTGYTLINFDLPYLLDRIKVLGLPKATTCLGRARNDPIYFAKNVWKPDQHNCRHVADLRISGRIVCDQLGTLQATQTLRSYTFDAVSAHFLGRQPQEDVYYTILQDWQAGSDETRRRLAMRVLENAETCLQIEDKVQSVHNMVELSRVCGVSFRDTQAENSSAIQARSMLHREAHRHNLLVPFVHIDPDDASAVNAKGTTTTTDRSDQEVETVEEEEEEERSQQSSTAQDDFGAAESAPVMKLNFDSLYPSLLLAHNLCYSTCVVDTKTNALSTEPPSNHHLDDETTSVHSLCVDLESKQLSPLPSLDATSSSSSSSTSAACKPNIVYMDTDTMFVQFPECTEPAASLELCESFARQCTDKVTTMSSAATAPAATTTTTTITSTRMNDHHSSLGVVPCIVRDLLEARKMAKRDATQAVDPLEIRTHLSRATAYKTATTTIVDFVLHNSNELNCPQLPRALTAHQRTLLLSLGSLAHP